MDVLEVRDTRDWEEEGDGKWHPIPGSGTVNECARCGREHEVWATVRDGERTEVVGTGCMRAAGLDAATIRKMETGAKRRARLEREIPALEAELREAEGLLACWNETVREVALLEHPPIQEGHVVIAVGKRAGKSMPTLRCGDGDEYWLQEWADRRDVEREAVEAWRFAQVQRRTGLRYAPLDRIGVIRTALARARRAFQGV